VTVEEPSEDELNRMFEEAREDEVNEVLIECDDDEERAAILDAFSDHEVLTEALKRIKDLPEFLLDVLKDVREEARSEFLNRSDIKPMVDVIKQAVSLISPLEVFIAEADEVFGEGIEIHTNPHPPEGDK
jgi:isoleucyl-tRNA synthetase